MNILQRGQAMLNRVALASAGVTLTYSRKVDAGTVEKELTGWVGRTVFSRNDQSPGARVVFGERDYLIPVAALQTAFGATGTDFLPRAGDRFVVRAASGGVPDPRAEEVFEVMAPAGEPVHRYSDQTRTLFRIHCKRV